MSSKHVAHGCRRENDAELLQLTDDAHIAPARILPREAKDERDDFGIKRVRSDLFRTRVCPGPANEISMPAHQRGQRHEEGGPAFPWKQSSERRQHGAISGGESGTRNLATEYRELMAQNGDLDILLVRCRADPDDVEQLSNEQEGD